ncbi:hypothetical protein AX16_001965 [Volvariella volvacea WC 439]|nr:hypothetical protein AX16_001965 [Volvariella volvacea WC 439]
MAPLITIINHTTASLPRPHVLYSIRVDRDGKQTVVNRRYSEFIELHTTLGDEFQLPPKRLLVTTFLPAAWVDDALIAERKTGLTKYLNDLVQSPQYKDSSELITFLSQDTPQAGTRFNLEDALPSTLSRKAALQLGKQIQHDLDDLNNENVEVNISASSKISAAYYTNWSISTNPPEKIDFSKFDILFYAFVMPTASGGIEWDYDGQSVLRRLVTSARNSGKGSKVVLSIGGWGGSYHFSSAVSTAAKRNAFTSALVNVVTNYDLDGVDLDWEYPNSPGAGNPYSASDSANFLSLLKSLRSALGPSAIISAAVPHLPWIGANGRPLTDVSDYATQMTFINIMNYDVWGTSSTPGPNAPLGNLCGTSSQPHASAQAAVQQWKTAGFPVSKMLLGLALYGYVSRSSKTILKGSLMPSSDMLILEQTQDAGNETGLNFLNGAHPRGKEAPIEEANFAAANLTSWWGQQIPFKTLVKSGALMRKPDGTYGQGGGFTMGWDDCSDTPYLFNTAQQTVVTYDDTWSLADKAKFAKQSGLAGCFTWSLDQVGNVLLDTTVFV